VYAFSENDLIASRELEGLERIFAANGQYVDRIGESNDIRVLTKGASLGEVKENIASANNSALDDDVRNSASSYVEKNSLETFSSADRAANEWGKENENKSYSNDLEYGAGINSLVLWGEENASWRWQEDGTDKDGQIYLLTATVDGETTEYDDGTKKRSLDMQLVTKQSDLVPGELNAVVHTHGMGTPSLSEDYFGGFGSSDQGSANKYGIPVYLYNKHDDLLKYSRILHYYGEGSHLPRFEIIDFPDDRYSGKYFKRRKIYDRVDGE